MPLAYQSIIALFIGGGLGAACRHFLSLSLQRFAHLQSFWSILVVNLIGCLMIGILSGLLIRPSHEALRILLITGFLGSFTTYSTFMLDIVSLTQKGMMLTTISYLFINLVAGFFLCCLGLILARAIISG